MKLVIDNNNNIVCKISRNLTNKQITNIIKKDVWNSNIIKRSAEKKESWIRNNMFINKIDEIDINNSFSVDLWDNQISIYGDDGIIELQIIELKNIVEL